LPAEIHEIFKLTKSKAIHKKILFSTKSKAQLKCALGHDANGASLGYSSTFYTFSTGFSGFPGARQNVCQTEKRGVVEAA